MSVKKAKENQARAVEKKPPKEDDYSWQGWSTPTAEQAWLSMLKSLPLLTEEEETELGKVLLEGDEQAKKEAKEKMFKGNLRLVAWVARRYREFGVPLIDLIQEGNMALVRVIENFDWRLGRFASYAFPTVNHAIMDAVAKHRESIHVPHDVMQLYHAINRLGSRGDPKVLAELLEVSLTQVRDALSVQPPPLSLDERFMDGTTRGDWLAADTPDPCDIVCNKEQDDLLTAALEALPSREALVLTLRFGLLDEDEHTLGEVAKLLNLSPERVRQLETRAMRSVRTAMKGA